MVKCVSGGMPVVRPMVVEIGDRAIEPYRSLGISLLSDLHEGRADQDSDLIDAELEKAYERDDRILLGGDIFELVHPSDKRYDPSQVHSAYLGRNDLQNLALDRMEYRLARYADNIDGIGIGNHESKGLAKTSFDIVAELVKRLNTHRDCTRPPIAQLGISSYIEYRVTDGGKKLPPFLIWYHHGFAKTSESHRALRTLHEKAKGFYADLYWSGHSHALGQTAETQMTVHRGQLVPRPVRHVLTGAYISSFQDQGQKSMIKHGRKSNYVVEAGYNPHALGGARVQLTWGESPFPKVQVTQ